MTDPLRVLRRSFQPGRSGTFLNFAATAPLLVPSAGVIAALAHEATESPQGHFTKWLAHLESARAAVADVIGASPEAIAFTTNTSSALSLAAGAIRWRPGDRVLYPADEFPSNRYVWQNLEGFGVIAQALPIPAGARLAEVLASVDLTGVRAVSFSVVSYADGRREDIAAVTAVCRPRGILVVVDAIQAVGAVQVGFDASNCDFLACGGQKWLMGPVGSGFLAVRPSLLDTLHVPLVGWASSRDAGDFDVEALTFADGARRFEPGLPDVPAVAALHTSIATLGSAGWLSVFAAVAAHNQRLRDACIDMGYRVAHTGAASTQAGIVTLDLVSAERAEQLAQRLAARNVVVTYRARHAQIRLAAHAVTGDDEVEAALEVLDANRAVRRRGERAPRADAPDSAVVAGRAQVWRLALVTGASRGLGQGIAAALASRGCSLVLFGRDEFALTAAAETLRAEHGVQVTSVALDLSDEAALAGWLAKHQAELAGCDVLVNCAAEAQAGLFDEITPEAVRGVLLVNVVAPIRLAQAVVPSMVDRGYGAVLNVVTEGARNAMPLFGTYAASKAALWAWSESLGRELAGTGVTVTAFLPARMDSRTSRRLGRRALAYFNVDSPAPLEGASATVVGEQAVVALAAGHALVMPARVRLRLAVNVLLPALISARVASRWLAFRRLRRRRLPCAL